MRKNPQTTIMVRLKKKWENFKEWAFLMGILLFFILICILGALWPILKTLAVFKYLTH